MSIWDDYKTSVRTRINVKQDRLLLTERQWKLKHYVKLNDKCGKYLWVNAYCPNQELYLWDEEVRKMTDEELATYRAEENNVINWSWWYVLSPTLIYAGLWFITAIIIFFTDD